MAPGSTLLLAAGVVFAALALAGSVAWWLDQSVIPAYLLVGLALAPTTPWAGAIPVSVGGEFVDLFAQLGVVFLLFFIGVEFSVPNLLADPGPTLRAGTLDLVVNAGLGVALGFAVGLSLPGALFLGAVTYPSSSAVITKTLVDLGWIADPESEAIIGLLVFEDLVMAVYLAALAVVAFGLEPAAALASLGQSGVLLLGFAVLAVYGSRHVERLFAIRSNELFLLRVVGLTVLLSGFALAAGVSEAVAAFFVGAAVSESELTERLERVLEPARDLFAAVFFFAIGWGTDFGAVAAVWELVAAGVALGLVGKLASGYAGGLTFGLDPRRATRVALAMVTRGEFSLVVAALAVAASDPLPAVVPAFAVGYVLAMSVLGTVLMRDAAPFERRMARYHETVAAWREDGH
jgi:CPA2 family monovalent cation:H+ antiporter-2